ncbi:MAG: type IX secretion system membrane protein PorP/SprF [Bacteroidota bacterium]
MIQFKISIFIIIIAFAVKAYGQEDTRSSLFWNNLSIYNPAETGGLGKDSTLSHYFSTNGQISSLAPDSSSMRSFNMLYEIKITSKNGIGINYQQDKVGFKINNQVNLNYSHSMHVGKGYLSAGIGTGYASNNFFNLNGGLMYTTNRLRTGIGITHINHSKYEPLKYNFSKTQNYYLSYQYSFITKSLMFTPMVFIRSIMSHTNMDIGILAHWNKFIFVGIGYRTDKTILYSAGVSIKKILLTYAYNYEKPNVSVLNNSSHEVGLKIRLK